MDIAVRKEFDYLIPEEIKDQVQVGSRVKVPFGPREVLATVTALPEKSSYSKLRPISKVLGRNPLLTGRVLQLARWIAEYYCCSLEVALKSVLPESVRQERSGWRERLFVRACAAPQGASPKLTDRQGEILKVVREWHELPLQELLKLTGTTKATVKRLEDKGLVTISHRVSERDPYAGEQILPTTPLTLNDEQARALAAINTVIDNDSGSAPGRTFLLHGVTGSGKTEVYLQAIAHALEQGSGAIVLVPEISLTPQTVERFKARFSSGPSKTLVAVLHSQLSTGERHDEWHKIREGRARIVIGARSAIFAPVEPLGLIIVDEEHETSYKQEEAPRYHARDVAVLRGQLEQTAVVLGSATPSLESYANAKRGKYRLLEMPSRADEKKMPLVRVVDMRSEARKQKGPPIFSIKLVEAMRQRLERHEQTLLFLNRRGYASSVQCPLCGYVAGCPHCSVSLTYHLHKERLCCHICGYEERVPGTCPSSECGQSSLHHIGLGTERVERTLQKLLPQARIKRMDSDALKRKSDYRRILSDFRVGKIDILVGTQMIAKGLHFPNVTLVGIIYADLGLHMADFRAGERTFQLLTQVAGRAGRGDVEGEVFVQSFTPSHPAIQHARRHDFVGFYEQEMEFRSELGYPPDGRIAMLTLKGRSEDKVSFSADHLKSQLETECAGFSDLRIAGPAPAPLVKAESFFRYQLMLRTRKMSQLSRLLADVIASVKFPEAVTLAIDIDPVNLA